MSSITTVQNQLFNPCVQTYPSLQKEQLGGSLEGFDTDSAAPGVFEDRKSRQRTVLPCMCFSMFRSMINQEHVRYMVCSVIVLEDGQGN